MVVVILNIVECLLRELGNILYTRALFAGRKYLWSWWKYEALQLQMQNTERKGKGNPTLFQTFKLVDKPLD